MTKPINSDEEYQARMAALPRGDITQLDLATCEHMMGEIKAALAYCRRALQDVEAHRREMPLALYRTLHQAITVAIQLKKRTLYDLLRRQEVNLQRLASTDLGQEAPDA
jgi:hypothetical protein